MAEYKNGCRFRCYQHQVSSPESAFYVRNGSLLWAGMGIKIARIIVERITDALAVMTDINVDSAAK